MKVRQTALAAVVLALVLGPAGVAPSHAQTVVLDASEAIRQAHMSDLITSGEQLQQDRFRSMMTVPGSYGGGGGAPTMSRQTMSALSQKLIALDAFEPDPAGTQAYLDYEVAYYRKPGHVLPAPFVAVLGVDGTSPEFRNKLRGLVNAWHTVAREKRFRNTVSSASFAMIQGALYATGKRIAPIDRASTTAMVVGFQNYFVMSQLLGDGRSATNVEKQEEFDKEGVVALVLVEAASTHRATRATSDLAASLLTDYHLTGDAPFPTMARSFASHTMGGVVRRYQSILALR